MNTRSANNPQLVASSIDGDHDAFRQIVEQYQNLICSLALSACGNVAKSEDLTQETFLIAWQRLRELREPSHLRSWLCGIVRNVARNARRKPAPGQFDPESSNGPAFDAADTSQTPHELASAREEAAIVEQALAEIPEAYREPLVLFYREDQSVAHVADALELSPDAVRQRLTRGRTMLRNQVEAVIERSLRNTKPTSALTIAIMAAIPGIAVEAKAAVVVGTAAKAAPAAAKAVGAWSLLSAAASPLICLAAMPFFARAAERAGNSPAEKKYLVRFSWQIGYVVLALALVVSVLCASGTFMMEHPIWFGALLAGSILVQVAVVLFVSVRADRRLKQIRLEDQRL